LRFSLAIAAVLWATGTAVAGNSSAYTDFDLAKCTRVTPETSGEDGESSGIFQCAGYKGVPVYFTEGDLRSFVAFGTGGDTHCAFHQTFSGFNSVGNKIEWRLRKGKPIAAILRWKVSYDPENAEKTKDWLVVSKLANGQSCQMGYVEGGYPKANEKARWLADTAAEVFSCDVGKTIIFANPSTPIEGVAPQGGCTE
jgi:hypothetical protein